MNFKISFVYFRKFKNLKFLVIFVIQTFKVHVCMV